MAIRCRPLRRIADARPDAESHARGSSAPGGRWRVRPAPGGRAAAVASRFGSGMGAAWGGMGAEQRKRGAPAVRRPLALGDGAAGSRRGAPEPGAAGAPPPPPDVRGMVAAVLEFMAKAQFFMVKAKILMVKTQSMVKNEPGNAFWPASESKCSQILKFWGGEIFGAPNFCADFLQLFSRFCRLQPIVSRD